MNLKQLQEIGFTAAEAEIYLVMLVLGKASAKQILERITTTKTTLYTVLDTFEKERLVMKEKEGKKTVFNQLRFIAKVSKVKKQTLDPATGVQFGRKFINRERETSNNIFFRQ